MKKILVIIIALIGFDSGANAEEPCSFIAASANADIHQNNCYYYSRD